MADILLVDDDDALRRVINRRLSQEGHIVMAEAANGLMASHYLRVQTPDLMITDIVMPDMDGLQLILETKKKSRHMKILAITGGGATDPDLRLTLAQNFGADCILHKPFRLDDLVEKAQALLQA